MKTKVLMVCLGNICRSPLAEGILKSKVDPERVYIDSAGTGNYHIGSPPDPRSIEVAAKYNIDIKNQRCRQFTPEDYDIYDYIYTMDRENNSNVLAQARNDKDVQKVSLILEGIRAGISEVPDPYYGGESGFEDVFQLLEEACTLIAQKLQDF